MGACPLLLNFAFSIPFSADAVLLYAFDHPTAPVDRTIARVLSCIFLGHGPKPTKPRTDPIIVSLPKRTVPAEKPTPIILPFLISPLLFVRRNLNVPPA